MKIKWFYNVHRAEWLFTGLFLLFAVGCTTTSGSSVRSASGRSLNAGSAGKTSAAVPKKQYSSYIDWKDRGFGKKLPLWLPAALKNDFTLLRKDYAQCNGRTVLIVYSKRQNFDQAYDRVASCVIDTHAVNVENMTCIGSTWVHVRPEHTDGDDDYFLAARVYTAPQGTKAVGNILISAD